MPRYSYERLSAQDNMFLLMERPNVHMHVAATLIYESGALGTADGGVDIARYKRAVESVLHRIPRYRQKLRWIPFQNHPVWVDDRHFNIDNHILHRALPRPGNLKQLRDLSAHIMSRQLDRDRPLWEMWVVEGLAGDRFAVISKIHHCMVDGASGVDLAHIMMSPTPQEELPEPVPYYPKPAPSPAELVRDEVARVAMLPLRATRHFTEFTRQAEDLYEELAKRGRALAELAGWAVRSASETPLNGRLSPHRRFDWLNTPLARVKAVRKALGCTVNDVVLATVSGAVRDYLTRRRVDPGEIDFRVSAPVSVRKDDERGKLGNRVSAWIIRLPIDRDDPLACVEALAAATRELKESEQALGVDLIMRAAEWAPAGLMSLGAQASSGPINTIVTNVPGPQFPLYTLGARLVAMYPQVPLLENMGLGVALFSYDGQLCWGFNADFELVPDLGAFKRAIEDSFERLCQAAGVGPKLEAAKPGNGEAALAQPAAGAPAPTPIAVKPAGPQ
jgi:WS/DGAT/MGAT family acyltransferase